MSISQKFVLKKLEEMENSSASVTSYESPVRVPNKRGNIEVPPYVPKNSLIAIKGDIERPDGYVVDTNERISNARIGGR